jgi:hypothetical protein
MAIENAPHNSTYWYGKADEARARADGMHDSDAVQTMLKVAHIYEALGKRAAEQEANPKRPSPSAD